ncbi:helicase SRCAP [Pseudophryne corroboree]|uniref:helicase SRCAP n=1 Tax=Pseudophryne corroboree TaxID=495146 RepID=UPI0030813D5C
MAEKGGITMRVFQEAEIENRIAELRREGFWTPRRLSKFPEPNRPKVQWDYLCEEMQWLAADFGQERRWKRGVARKVVRMVVRHHEELKQKEERARREEQGKLKRIATSIAKEVRQFWSNVEKVVQFKQQSRLEEKRKKALDLQLDFIVGQTEKYSDLLSQSLSETMPMSKTSSSCVGSSQGGSLRTSPTPSVCHKDGDFLPHEDDEEEEDDEETIEMEERQEGNDAEAHRLELELLRRESELPLDELLQNLPPEILQEDIDVPDQLHNHQHSDTEEEEDGEFTANEDEAEDEEDTIQAEEELAGQQDHVEELCQLAREGEMSLDDLLLKYSVVQSEEELSDQSGDSQLSDQETSESSNCESSDCESEGVEFLLKQDDDGPGIDQLQQDVPEPKKEITDIAATAESLQPKGYTLATTQVKTAVPFLLRGDLREYQHIGLEWLVTMYEKKLNGILADEMGLGKTIQTISLLAHLACDRGNWGPHLIIVPTSVILNWEMELKRWCPSFKILTYYGSQKERKLKRQGWTKANAFHVCITSYKLVLQDHQAFRRKNWRYLILDEAQNIKNFKSQRWQSLLNFNSQRRLLLTGTPLQNSLMELWSLMHFLMPHVFQSHREFKEWFSNPLTGMIEGSQEYNEGLVRRLHKVLRPFLLRRIKLDVEKQMPKKYEHVIYCRLSKRQRFLYDDFMAQAATRETLASGHFMSVINILMQLRKVCNHPNLFDPRPIHSPFITSTICYTVPSLVLHALQRHPLEHVDFSLCDLINMEGRVSRYESDMFLPQHKPSRTLIQEIADSPEPPPRPRPLKMKVNRMLQPVVKPDPRSVVVVNSSRPVQRAPDMPSTSLPATLPPSASSPSSEAVTVATGPAQTAPIPQAPPLVQPSACPVPVTQVVSGVGKPVPVQNFQPAYTGAQRFILTPDMQARLPSGEVISLSQLASLSGRPLQNPSVTKPLTLQLQGAKLTLSGAQMRPLGVGQPRPMQGNVLHLVSSGGQHHLLSQPAQLALIQALAQQAAAPTASVPSQLVQNSVQALSVQSLQHTLLNSANIPTSAAAGMAPPGQVSASGVVKIVVRQATREIPAAPQRLPLAPPVRPLLRFMPGPHPEQVNAREGFGERAAPVVATSTLTLANSPLLMVSSPALASRLPSPSPVPPSTEDSPAPPMSGVALRLLATGTSAMQLTNHHSSPPRHTQSPALPHSSPNCSAAQIVGPDCGPCTVLYKPHNPDTALTDAHTVQNGNGLQRQESPSLTPNICVPTTCTDSALYVNLAPNSPSPPSSIPKLAPPTYNLSLVPALLANSAPATVSSYNPMPARFLTSPVSLLTLSPLPTTNSGTAPVLYTHPSATTFTTLSAPVPATSVSATLPLLAAPVSGQLAPFATHLPIPSANKSSYSTAETATPALLPVLSAPAPRPMLSAPAPRPVLAATAPRPSHLPAATASLLEAPMLMAPDAVPVPLLEASASDSLPPLVLNTALKIPSVASAPLPVLTASSAVSLLAAASSSSKVPIPLLNVSPASSIPLLAAAPAPSLLTQSPVSAFQAPSPCESASSHSIPVSLSSSLLSPTSCLVPARPHTIPLPPLRVPAPQPSLSVPASAPAPLPFMPASTPIPLPLLPASTPAPVSCLPVSSHDPASLLLVPAPAPSPVLSSSMAAPTHPLEPAPVPQLRSPATHPLVMSVSSPSALPAASPSLVVSTSSHMPLLPSHAFSAAALRPILSSGVAEPKSVPLPCSALSSSAPQYSVSPSTTPNVENTAVTIPEQSLSLSMAGPPVVSVTLGTPTETDISLEGDESRSSQNSTAPTSVRHRRQLPPPPRSPFYVELLEERRRRQKVERLERIFHLNERRCSLAPIYGTEVLSVCTLRHSLQTSALSSVIFTPEQRLQQLRPLIERFIFAMPPVEAPPISLHTSHPPPSLILQESVFKDTLSRELTPHSRCLHRIISNMRTQFPDLRLIQYDCGKLQTLDRLLRQLKSGGHRVLLFTQMTRMLDVLEQFLNYHGHIYLRLDGSTRVEQRQVLMERFNMDKRIFCFILSTRSGGVGVNLTGADTVIFYDSDWNPTMDAQAQDRCHRIGQTRDVHIYRLVSERTVEENILKKAQQKRMLGDMAIEGGNFTTAYFKQHTIRELFDMEDVPRKDVDTRVASPDHSSEEGASTGQAQILEQALCGAEDEEDTLAASLVRAEQVADLAEFNENIPLEAEEEEQSRAEQEISALVEQLTPIERYAMYYLEASLEEVSKEELKQAEEQVEAARKDLFLAKDEGGQITEEKWEEEMRRNRRVRTPTPARSSERVGVRMSERLRGNKVTESSDLTESPPIPDTTSPAQDDVCDPSPQTPTPQCVPEQEAPSPVAETPKSTEVAAESESLTEPPSVHPVHTSTEVESVKEEALPMETGGVPEPPSENVLESPSRMPQEENAPPRTPRRKVTADCEILLAGASSNSPTAKVLRRLPGRLVTVLEERIPTPRRQSRGRVQQPVTDNGTQSPTIPGSQSPSHDLLSEENSEAGSPPPKRKRGRPPKTRPDMSPTAVPLDMPTFPAESCPQVSPELETSPHGTVAELGTVRVQTPGSPSSNFKLNSECESCSPVEKRKRGRPPKRREASPIVTSPTSPVSFHGDSTPNISQSYTTKTTHIKSGSMSPTANAIIPNETSSIPLAGGEGTSSSGVDEPVTPPKRKRGRPPKSHAVSKVNSRPISLNDRLDSSPDRTPSPQITRTPFQRKLKPLKSETLDTMEHNSSLTDTDDSSGDEEIIIRTPLTRSARTRMQTSDTPSAVTKNTGSSSSNPRGRSPHSDTVKEKAPNKRRKPPSVSSPSPPSSSPHGSSSERQTGGRKRHCPPAERILRSSLTANPASNTRSSRPPLLNSPNSHRGRKAKT